MIWLKEKIGSWREAPVVNVVKILKSATSYLLVSKFCDFSKTVLRIVLVTDL